jgi:hypothetical protein
LAHEAAKAYDFTSNQLENAVAVFLCFESCEIMMWLVFQDGKHPIICEEEKSE